MIYNIQMSHAIVASIGAAILLFLFNVSNFHKTTSDLAILVEAAWPGPPFVDTCSGKAYSKCLTASECEWDTSSGPWCYDKNYRKQSPPTGIHNMSDYVERFFSFSFGVHLSEGTDQQIYYNLNTTECAVLCMKSSIAPKNIRCLSFDFYPFELPKPYYPYFEYLESGVCVLNSGNRDTARLRNEDLGFTDAELFYKSFYGSRPFSRLDGYYEVRDPRGGEIAEMLDYSGTLDFAPINVWGGSRWGITHLEVPQPVVLNYKCKDGEVVTADDPSEDPLFVAGYTPVTDFQHCPGMMSKADARDLCQATGGYLCKNQTVVQNLQGFKIGCSYDGYPIWDASADGSGPDRFVRCCTNYGIVDNCEKYMWETINKCAKLNTGGCVATGSGTYLQQNYGYGHMLEEYRKMCLNGLIPNCKGLVKDWSPRDDCILCLDPKGTEQCRPGGDFGICPTAPEKTKALFALKMKATCGPEAICRLIYKYPDLKDVLDVPTFAPTSSPTRSPSVPTLPPLGGVFDCKIANQQSTAADKRTMCNNHKDSCKWNKKKKKCLFK